MSDPYAGTGGTSGTLDQQSEANLALRGGVVGAEVYATDGEWWGADIVDRMLASYAKSDFSETVDSGLQKAKTQADKITNAADKWLGYASDPANIQSTLNTVMVIVVVLGVVYVLATVAPLLRPLAGGK